MTAKLGIVGRISALALRPLLGDSSDGVVSGIMGYLGDNSRQIAAALDTSHKRAWRAVEMALAGPSWWASCKKLFTNGEEKALAEQVARLLKQHPLPEMPGDPDAFRERCLADLKLAYKCNLLPGVKPDKDDVEEVANLARFEKDARPDEIGMGGIAKDLSRIGCEHLSKFITLRPTGGEPLLVVAVQFFFRCEVQSDEALARGLVWDGMQRLTREQNAAWEALADSLKGHEDRLARALDGIEEKLGEVKTAVSGVQAGVDQTNDTLAEMKALILALQAQVVGMAQQQSQGQATPMPASKPVPIPMAEAVEEESSPVVLTEAEIVCDEVDTLLATIEAKPTADSNVFRLAGQLREMRRTFGDRPSRPLVGWLPDRGQPSERPTPPPAPMPMPTPTTRMRPKQLTGSAFGTPPAEAEPKPDEKGPTSAVPTPVRRRDSGKILGGAFNFAMPPAEAEPTSEKKGTSDLVPEK